MEIIIKGGSKDLKERTIKSFDNNSSFAESVMSTSDLGEKMEGAIKKAVAEAAERTIVNTSNINGSEYKFEVRTNKRTNTPGPVEVVVKEDKKEEKPKSSKKESKKETSKKKEKLGAPVAPIVTEEYLKRDEEMTVNGVNPNAGIGISPISISDDRKKDFDSEEKIYSPVETIERSINTITKCMNDIDIDVVKDDILERLFIAVASMLPNNNKSLHMLISAARDIIDADIEEKEIDDHTIVDIEVILDYVGKSIIDNSDSEVSEDGPDYITELKESVEKLSNYNEELNVTVGKLTAENQELQTKYNESAEQLADLNKDYKNIEDERNDLQRLIDKVVEEKEQLEKQLESIESENISDDNESEEDPKITTGEFVGIRTFEAVTVDLKELLPGQEESHNIVVLVDEEDKYVAIDKLMIAIDEIDGISVDEAEYVSKEYISDLLTVAESNMKNEDSDEEAVYVAEENTEDDSDDDDSDDDSTEELTQVDVIPDDSNIAITTQQFLDEEDKLEV